MSKLNGAKSKALGMPHGTASNRLRKMILFSLVCQLGLNVCHRCGKEIISTGDLSIEHKEAWLQADDPVTAFFDLDNIAFFHLSCNSATGERPHRTYETSRDQRLAENVRRNERWRALPRTERQKRRREGYKRWGC